MGGNMFSSGPDKKDDGNKISLGIVVMLPFMVGFVIFCGLVIRSIGVR